LTQEGNPAATANRASLTASSALRAPLVLGKGGSARVDEIENIGERTPTGKIGASQRDRDELSPARFERVAHQFVGGKLAGANKQSRCKFAIGYFEFRPFIRHRIIYSAQSFCHPERS
jgi:hypothetical protein